MKTINEVNYNLVTLKCALADVEAKHGAHKRSTTGSTITSLVNKITSLVTKAEYVISDIEEMGSDAWSLLTMDSELGYLLDVANRCRFIYTARQRKRIVESLETILSALTLQFNNMTAYLTAPAVQEETTEVLEADEIIVALEADEIIRILEVKETIEVIEEKLIEVTTEEEADEVCPALVTTEALITYVIMASYIIKRIQKPCYQISPAPTVQRSIRTYTATQTTQNQAYRRIRSLSWGIILASVTIDYLKKMTLLNWEGRRRYLKRSSKLMNSVRTSSGGKTAIY